MSFERPESKSGNSIDRPPSHCTCGEDSAVVLLTVIRNGKTEVGPFSKFGYQKGDDLFLRDGITFGGWNVWCANCFTNHRKPPPSRYTQNQTRAAWMWFISKITEGTKLAMFQGRPVTPEQEEKFLRIVNDEAQRVNIPEAIPEGYRLRERPALFQGAQ